MQVPLELVTRDITLTATTEAEIRRRVERLEAYHQRLMACRVAVELPHRQHRTGSPYLVRLDVTFPGGEFAVTRKSSESLRSAVQEAFGAAERRLRELGRRQRGEVKRHEPPPVARVRELYPLAGYGFLEAEDGHTVYFDERSVTDGGLERLDVGARVRFVEEEGDKGPQARAVFPA